jgi:hypothetical protein
MSQLHRQHLSSNSNFNLNTSLNIDNDSLDNLSWRIEINQPLVDSHLEHIPGLGTFTVRCLSGGDLEDLGWEADGALDAEFLCLGTVDELGADLLEGLDVAGGEGDADLYGVVIRCAIGCIMGGFGIPCGLLGLRRSLSRLCCRTFLWLVFNQDARSGNVCVSASC